MNADQRDDHVKNGDEHDAANPPPRDELDGLLRRWHAENAVRAATGRDRLLRAVSTEPAPDSNALTHSAGGRSGRPGRLHRFVRSKLTHLVAALIAVAVLVPVLPRLVGRAQAQDTTIMTPQGGRLEAFNQVGEPIGPCALQHTDVKVEVSGLLSRTTVQQKYKNPFGDKIEAVYTFPMSHRAAVDRMSMIIGDRVVEGEVRERGEARAVYESARAQGRIASLLEQERPNIFTQSVANIEPSAEITIEISYVETLINKDGEYSIAIPMVVEPRYVPGNGSESDRFILPEAISQSYERRVGLHFLAPPSFSDIHVLNAQWFSGQPTPEALSRALGSAQPVKPLFEAGPPTIQPDGGMPSMERTPGDAISTTWCECVARYADGSAEPMALYQNGTGQVGGRWFYFGRAAMEAALAACPPPVLAETMDGAPPAGEPFSANTDQVPDAARITPTPVRPGTRAGHDISISVSIDSGGPGITDITCPLHRISRVDDAVNADGRARSTVVTLQNTGEIANRDFVLSWRLTDDSIAESVVAHAGDQGGFVSVTLLPPRPTADVRPVPRELIFVLDTSGSMEGWPIDTAKRVMAKAISAMHAGDVFNVITFAGNTEILWPTAKPATEQSIAESQAWLGARQGGGGTEMMTAINAALKQTPGNQGAASGGDAMDLAALANLPADGRAVVVSVDPGLVRPAPEGRSAGFHFVLESTAASPRINVRSEHLNISGAAASGAVALRGFWSTRGGERVLDVESIGGGHPARPVRIVMFMTDGQVGNDMAIIDAVRANRSTTRVFSFGVGNSVNRYLLDEMALAGGGESEYILIPPQDTESGSGGDAQVVDRFVRRTQVPVLTDISVVFDGSLPIVDALTGDGRALDNIPDLFDVKPLSILARFNGAASGNMVIRGMSADGPWERTIQMSLPASERKHDTAATLWARAKISQIMNADLANVQAGSPQPSTREQIVNLGTTFHILSQYTSFVAVDKLRITIAGQPRLVRIPIEMPDKVSWQGLFGTRGEQPVQVELSLLIEQTRKSMHEGPADALLLEVPADSERIPAGEEVAAGRQRSAGTDLNVDGSLKHADRSTQYLNYSVGRPASDTNGELGQQVLSMSTNAPPDQGTSHYFGVAEVLEKGVDLSSVLIGDSGEFSSFRISVGAAGGGGSGGAPASTLALPVASNPMPALGELQVENSQAPEPAADPVAAGQETDGADGDMHEAVAEAEIVRAKVVEVRRAYEADREKSEQTDKATQDGSADDDRAVPVQFVALAGVSFAEQGDKDRARRVAALILHVAPSYQPAVRLTETLDRSDWPDENARASQLADIRQAVLDELSLAINEAKLINRLSEDLYELVLDQRSSAAATTPDTDRAALDEPPANQAEPLIVSILTGDDQAAVRKDLLRAGAAEVVVKPSLRLIVCALPPTAIEAAALVDGVKRIERSDR